MIWGMPEKTLGLDAELRFSERIDDIDNRFLNVNGGSGGGDDDYNYFSFHQVVNMHNIIPIIMHRELALMYL